MCSQYYDCDIMCCEKKISFFVNQLYNGPRTLRRLSDNFA